MAENTKEKRSFDVGDKVYAVRRPKVQEISSSNLIKCLNLIEKFKKIDNTTAQKSFFIGCDVEIFSPLLEEFLKRFFSPLFIILIGLSSSLIIMSSKNDSSYGRKNIFSFCIGIIFIIISEITLRYSSTGIKNLIIYFLVPCLLFIIIYSYIYFNNLNLRRN